MIKQEDISNNIIEDRLTVTLKTNRIKVLTNICENQDKYSWTELNCFFKAWAIIYESFKTGYFDVFLFYTSFYYSFVIDGYFDFNSNGVNFFNLFNKFSNRVLKNVTGLYIKEIYGTSEEELHSKIIEQLDNDSPVLVPGDLFELSYNTGYKREFHPHYFIIKGYDAERKLYYILDNMHLDGGASTIYKDFTMRFTDLYILNRAFIEKRNIFKEYNVAFWCLCKSESFYEESSSIINKLSFYIHTLKKINEGKVEIKYLEHEAFKNMQFSKELVNMKSVIQQLNMKNVYYDILFKFLGSADFQKEAIDEMIQLKDLLVNKWCKIKSRLVYYSMAELSDIKKLEEAINENIEREKLFSHKMATLLENKAQNSMKPKEIICTDEKNFIEKNNNAAKILVENNNYTIIHSPDKRYDTWLAQDDAVQIIKYFKSSDNFFVNTKVITSSKIGSAFNCGIVIKLANGSKIFYGNHSGNTLTVICPENQDMFLFKQDLNSSQLYLKVKKYKNALIFYANQNNSKKMDRLFILKLQAEVVYAGIISRTWEKIAHTVEFLDTRISSY